MDSVRAPWAPPIGVGGECSGVVGESDGGGGASQGRIGCRKRIGVAHGSHGDRFHGPIVKADGLAQFLSCPGPIGAWVEQYRAGCHGVDQAGQCRLSEPRASEAGEVCVSEVVQGREQVSHGARRRTQWFSERGHESSDGLPSCLHRPSLCEDDPDGFFVFIEGAADSDAADLADDGAEGTIDPELSDDCLGISIEVE